MDEKVQKQTEALEKEVSDERGKLSTDRMDISFGELVNLYKNKELIIRPEYQRLFRWKPQQKTALIESILLSIPIPPIFVAEDKNGIWELVDGLQRVSTVISFFGELDTDISQVSYQIDSEEDVEDDEESCIGNKWALESGGLIENLEGFTIDTLPVKYKLILKRTSCRVEILRSDNNTLMKCELFKRLNSGGSVLTSQEIRNAIYRSANPLINDLISDLSQNPSFQKLTDLSLQKKQVFYDHELILKFIAFLNNVEEIDKNTQSFLNSFMEKSVSKDSFDTQCCRDIFNQVITMLDNTGEKKIFRNSRNLFVPSYFEGITIGLAQNMKHYIGNIDLLKAKIRELKGDKKFRQISASDSKSRVKARLRRANEIFASVNNE